VLALTHVSPFISFSFSSSSLRPAASSGTISPESVDNKQLASQENSREKEAEDLRLIQREIEEWAGHVEPGMSCVPTCQVRLPGQYFDVAVDVVPSRKQGGVHHSYHSHEVWHEPKRLIDPGTWFEDHIRERSLVFDNARDVRGYGTISDSSCEINGFHEVAVGIPRQEILTNMIGVPK
jgi:hypothetical protein